MSAGATGSAMGGGARPGVSFTVGAPQTPSEPTAPDVDAEDEDGGQSNFDAAKLKERPSKSAFRAKPKFGDQASSPTARDGGEDDDDVDDQSSAGVYTRLFLVSSFR